MGNILKKSGLFLLGVLVGVAGTIGVITAIAVALEEEFGYQGLDY